MKRRTFRASLGVGILFILVCTSLNISWAAGDKYPSRAIELCCAYPAGGHTDLLTRAVAKGLEKYLGVTVVVINKPGGGGVVSNTAVINARPDGYTLGNTAVMNLVSPLVLGQATYSLEDLHVIGNYGITGTAIAVSVDSPWKTFQGFLDYEKKNPGVKYGHPGVGTGPYIKMENLIRIANLKMINVPFKGDVEVASALLGKHIPIGLLSTWFSKVQEDGGKLRMLFNFEPPHKFGLSSNIPDVLTAFGKSAADRDLEVLRVLFAPRQTPNEILKLLEQTLEKLTKDPEFIISLGKFGVSPEFRDSNTVAKILPVYMAGVKAILKP